MRVLETFQASSVRAGMACALVIAIFALDTGLHHADAAQISPPDPAGSSAVAERPAQQTQDNARRFAAHTTLLALIVGGVLVGIALARRGHALPIREIPGLSAFGEAVARATEMGRPSLFTTGGVCDIRRVQLYASMPLLRRVASLSGELGNRLIV